MRSPWASTSKSYQRSDRNGLWGRELIIYSLMQLSILLSGRSMSLKEFSLANNAANSSSDRRLCRHTCLSIPILDRTRVNTAGRDSIKNQTWRNTHTSTQVSTSSWLRRSEIIMINIHEGSGKRVECLYHTIILSLMTSFRTKVTPTEWPQRTKKQKYSLISALFINRARNDLLSSAEIKNAKLVS